MEKELINFKEWKWNKIHLNILKNQKLHLEYKITKSKCKNEEKELRKRLHIINNEIKKANWIEF